jgi:hypothetical protein
MAAVGQRALASKQKHGLDEVILGLLICRALFGLYSGF